MKALDIRDLNRREVIEKITSISGIKQRGRHVAFGWGGKSIGFPTTRETWCKVVVQTEEVVDDRRWDGEELATSIQVPHPALLGVQEYSHQGNRWKVLEFAQLPAGVISTSPEARRSYRLGDLWWQELRAATRRLALTPTTRTAVRQDLVTRRLSGLLAPDVNLEVDEWTTAHADLHWSNLARPKLAIIDWEGWGRAPRGLDAATLWAFSLAVPSLAKKVEEVFEEDLACRSGELMKLFMCVELLRMTDQFGDYPLLRPRLVEQIDLARQRRI